MHANLYTSCLFVILLGCSQAVEAQVMPEFAEQRILADGIYRSAPETLSEYIKKESLSYNEKKAGKWLKNVCLENGLFISQFGEENGSYNFSASLYPLKDSLPNIIFLNHIDVVPEGDTGLWKFPPFSGHICDSVVWGRGAFDNKGVAIMQLFSLINYKNSLTQDTLPYNVTFLSVSCEEVLCDGGVKYVTDNYLPCLNPAVVIGEGATELSNIIHSEKGSAIFGISVAHKIPLWIKLQLTINTSNHGSVTPLEYANKEMTIALSRLFKRKTKIIFTKQNRKILKNLGMQEKGIKKFILKHPVLFKFILAGQLRKQPALSALFSNTFTVTDINSNNETVNIIPSTTTVLMDCRLLPTYSEKKFINKIERKIRNDDVQLKTLAKMEQMRPSDIRNPFYENMESAIKSVFKSSTVFPIMLPNYNDVGAFRSHGIPAYSVIPVQLSLDCLKCVHAENERIPISALHQGISVYLKFIELCEENGKKNIKRLIVRK